ncbi:hypothetical protein [Sorangium sp. So ce1182]|uniref:hypothetical protein n=1 Tax=Sorangium sp. So ce1182 TaxID=3133334 RepID=UPI003F63B305
MRRRESSWCSSHSERCPLQRGTHAGVAAWAAENIDLGLGLGHVEPLVLGPTVVPEITDPADAEAELAVLSAVAHGNGPNGLTVVQTALVPLGRRDQEHAMVYFQLIWNGWREPMQQALEALVMERQIEGEATFPPFVQKLVDRGKLEGIHEGNLEGKRDTLLRLLARAGMVLAEKRTRARASKHARTLRPSTAGSMTPLGRRLPPKCSPDG